MTPKEKGEALVNTYYQLVADSSYPEEKAKECALIAVDEIIGTLNHDIRDLDVRGSVLLDLIKYWTEVKQEINNI